MIPTITASRPTGGAPRDDLPLLVLGPSLGTSVATLWGTCARHLADDFDVLGWDLPGHGFNPHVPAEPFTMAELAAGVLRVVDEALELRGEPGGAFAYAGDSVGGAVGLQLALDAPDRLVAAALMCTGARLGDEASWADRIAQVRTSGTSVMVNPSAQRWFGPGFLERAPERGSGLLHALSDTDDAGYVRVCEALAHFDVRDRLGEVEVPVLAVAGSHDVATPPELLRTLADGVRHGAYVELSGVAHLPPAERPDDVADLLRHHLRAEEPVQPSTMGGMTADGTPDETPDETETAESVREAGMRVRRDVLGDAHVDRAVAGTTDLTGDFQDFITRYAWGSVWTRPGLDRRSRSMVTLTALVAHGHDDELALHLRAARRNGLTWEEIREVLLQTAVYCGVPAANTAFRIAQHVLDEERETP
jgi:3-oxoadipate enol-lactonase/4-carboxymuconolactone decarboxylase